MISSHPKAQKLHHMAILNKPLRPGDKFLLHISHSSQTPHALQALHPRGSSSQS